MSRRSEWAEALGRVVHRGIHGAEEALDRARAGLRRAAGAGGPLTIHPYRGFGTRSEARLMGRVLEEEDIPEPEAGHSAWRNALSMYLRFESDEIPGAVVEARAGADAVRAVADEEGYFELTLEARDLPGGELPGDGPWHEVELTLIEAPGREVPAGVRAVGSVLVPSPDARFGVISDVDDTVLRTGAIRLLDAARSTLLGNARTRLPFAGAATFYRALASPGNPLFYVSSSPWNLYDFLEDFLEIHGLPPGPLLLRDLGVDEEKLISSGHGHKLGKIDRVLAAFPDLPFVLIGDSGQEDPEIYRRAVARFPERIRAVYIRDVTGESRDAEVRALAEEVRRHGVEMRLVPDSAAAAEHAAGIGLIDPGRVDAVRAEVESARG